MISEPVIHVLNDLITINKNRVIGTKEILHELEEEELKEQCQTMVANSERNIEELSSLIKNAGAEVEDKTATSGFIYNTWMNIAYNEEKESADDLHTYLQKMEEATLNGYDALLKELRNGATKESNIIHQQRDAVAYSLERLLKLLK